MPIQELFIELIRVSLGIRESLSCTPTEKEWERLYKLARKQSVVGICFAGLQRLGANLNGGFANIGISNQLYLTWIGKVAKIQNKNRIASKRCIELQRTLETNGFRFCVLKGQGVASLYGNGLSELRQAGDIDILLWKEGLSPKENKNEIIKFARTRSGSLRCGAHHIHTELYEDIDVELHYYPCYLSNPWANYRLRKWSKQHRTYVESCREHNFTVPNTEYNIVFLLSHAFRHYLGEGLGLRQVMDYYFVLKDAEENENKIDLKEIQKTVCSLNMHKFAKAMMWVMQEVFDMNDKYLITEPNPNLGKQLLSHILRRGNFGHYNNTTIASKNSHIGRFINQLCVDLQLAINYPGEALWAPLTKIREFTRQRI